MSQELALSGEDDDFSKRTFTYTQDYELIKLGANGLTAKISCYDNGDSDLNPFPAAVLKPPLLVLHYQNGIL